MLHHYILSAGEIEAGQSQSEVEKEHPRLSALLEKYGPMSTSAANLDDSAKSLASQMTQAGCIKRVIWNFQQNTPTRNSICFMKAWG